MLLHTAAQNLGLDGQIEDLALRTIRQDVRVIHGHSVSFSVSSVTRPKKSFQIQNAFTAEELGLSKHTHPTAALQKRYRHLRDLPLLPFSQVQPLLLIGSDFPHLINPIAPVRLGPPGGPAALKTPLGWTLQGPSKFLLHHPSTADCLFTNIKTPSSELMDNVAKLWQLDVMPYRSEKLITRSKQDKDAVRMLEEKTVRVEVNGVQRYATPLLWKNNLPPLQAPKEAVLGHLRGTEKRLSKDPNSATIYNKEIRKLLDVGYVRKLSPADVEGRDRSWYIPHHMVHHNGKDRIVFNCSFRYHGKSLNEHLLPGPTLGASLLGVLLRFREHPVAISSDVKGMFHQVQLLAEDKPLLRFLWRDMNT